MKKSVAAFWVFTVGSVLVFTTSFSAEAEAQLLDRIPSFRNLADQLKTPEAIARYIWRNFEFETDRRHFGTHEYWQTPEEILHTRKGDCEDFAVFAQAILKANGISAFLVNIYGGKYAHTICVFKEDGVYHALDGTKVRRSKSKDLRGLITEIYPFWKESALVAPAKKSSHGRLLAKFERQAKIQRRLATSA